MTSEAVVMMFRDATTNRMADFLTTIGIEIDPTPASTLNCMFGKREKQRLEVSG